MNYQPQVSVGQATSGAIVDRAAPATFERPAGTLDGTVTTQYDSLIGSALTRSTYGVDGTGSAVAVIDTGVPANVLASALFQRFSSRGESEFADKLLSAMRYEFGGHVEKAAGK